MVVLVDDPLAPEFLGKLIPPLGETIEEDRREEKEWVEKISERSVELLRAAAIKVTCVVKEGDPKRELCKAAEEWALTASSWVPRDSAIALSDSFWVAASECLSLCARSTKGIAYNESLYTFVFISRNRSDRSRPRHTLSTMARSAGNLSG